MSHYPMFAVSRAENSAGVCYWHTKAKVKTEWFGRIASPTKFVPSASLGMTTRAELIENPLSLSKPGVNHYYFFNLTKGEGQTCRPTQYPCQGSNGL